MKAKMNLIALLYALFALPGLAFAATYYGDTNGDGVSDTVTTTTSSIQIYHPNLGTTKTYNISGTFAVYTLSDTDGVTGLEVVVVRPNIITVINDRLASMGNYNYPSTTYAIHSVSNTNSVVGNEIIVTMPNYVNVIHDSNGSISSYPFLGTTYGINSVADTNGAAGNEHT